MSLRAKYRPRAIAASSRISDELSIVVEIDERRRRAARQARRERAALLGRGIGEACARRRRQPRNSASSDAAAERHVGAAVAEDRDLDVGARIGAAKALGDAAGLLERVGQRRQRAALVAARVRSAARRRARRCGRRFRRRSLRRQGPSTRSARRARARRRSAASSSCIAACTAARALGRRLRCVDDEDRQVRRHGGVDALLRFGRGRAARGDALVEHGRGHVDAAVLQRARFDRLPFALRVRRARRGSRCVKIGRDDRLERSADASSVALRSSLLWAAPAPPRSARPPA